MFPHSIRLRGPWEYAPLARTQWSADGTSQSDNGDLPPASRLALPASWGAPLGRDFRGHVRFKRIFHRPTGLTARDSVWLVIEGADPAAAVSLNGHALGRVEGCALFASFDITTLLAADNELVLDIDLPQGAPFPRPGREHLAGGPIGEVRLEVRGRCFLDDLSVSFEMTDDGMQIDLGARVGGDPSVQKLTLVASGLDRDWVRQDVSVGETVAFREIIEDPKILESLGVTDDPLELPPIWTLTVDLLADGQVVWHRALLTGVRVPPFRITPATGTKLPADVDIIEPKHLKPLVEDLGERVMVLDRILSPECYTALDNLGARVKQRVPKSWAPAVRARLAHHVAIVAWEETPD